MPAAPNTAARAAARSQPKFGGTALGYLEMARTAKVLQHSILAATTVSERLSGCGYTEQLRPGSAINAAGDRTGYERLALKNKLRWLSSVS